MPTNIIYYPSPLINPMTTAGDIIIESSMLVPTRLPIGSNGQVLTVSGGIPAWETASSSAANVPWLDIQNYGGFPDNIFFRGETAEVTTVGNSPNVVLNTPRTFLNGQGVTIWKAGNPTTQSTPAAPASAVLPVVGSQSIKYAVVGYDSLSGLTAISPTYTVTTAPTVFGPPTQTITSINQSGGVVTVNFANPLNHTVTSGMTLHLYGVTGTTQFNGIWPIASAPSTSQVTFSLAGSAGSGTVSAASQGRVSNTQIITAISRDANGVISITTDQNHGWQTGPSYRPTIVILENITPQSLNGHYVLQTASGNTATTYPTSFFSSVTGAATTPVNEYGTSVNMTATVWESITIACPALSGSPVWNTLAASATLGYYIYSDSPNPGGALQLIGKTLYQESHFTDYGQYFGGGYIAPAYVPTTAPSLPQNQMFTTTILSGGGTTQLTLAANVPSTLSSLSGTIMHDDGPALVAAATARLEFGFQNGPVLLSPSKTLGNTIAFYIFNSPINVPEDVDLLLSCGMVINETITWGTLGNTNARMMNPVGSVPSLGVDFGLQGYAYTYGIGNPMLVGGIGATIDGISFRSQNPATGLAINGQNLVMTSGGYTTVRNSAFDCEDQGNSIGLCFNGDCASLHLTDLTITGENGFVSPQNIPGSSALCPIVGALVFRASDNTANGAGVPCGTVVMDGTNLMSGRGIVVDGQYATGGFIQGFTFGDSIWNQATETPALVITNTAAADNFQLTGFICDSVPVAVIGNFVENLTDVQLNHNSTSEMSLPSVTGNLISGLRVFQEGRLADALQSIDCVQDLYGTASTGGISFSNPDEGGSPHSSATMLARPLIISSAYGVVLCPVAPVSFTVATSGVGTIPAGTYFFGLTSIGHEGGESALLPDYFLSVTVNGSQGILVSWTPVSGMASVNVYANVSGQPLVGQTSSPLTGTSHTFTTLSTGGQNYSGSPSLDGTGLPLIAQGLIITPTLILPQGIFKTTIQPATLSANRTVSLADGAGSVIVSTALTTSGATSDTVTLQGATSSSHAWVQATNATAAADVGSATGVAVTAVGSNSVTVTHSNTSGETFNVFATVN